MGRGFGQTEEAALRRPAEAAQHAVSERSRRRHTSDIRHNREAYLQAGMGLGQMIANFGARMKWPDPGEHGDGRVDAIDVEREWTAALPEKFLYRGSIAEVISESPEHGWKSNSRFWVDIAVRWRGQVFFYNLKAGSNEAPGNVCGMRGISYLLGADMQNELMPEKFDLNTLPRQIAKCLDARRGRVTQQPREYFLIHADTKTHEFRTLPLTGLKQGELRINPENGLQVSFQKARRLSRPRSQRGAQKQIAAAMRDYLRRRAEPYMQLESILEGTKVG